MSFIEHLKKISIIAVTMLIIDVIWLKFGLVLLSDVNGMVSGIQQSPMTLNYYMGGFTYILMVASFYYFIVMKEDDTNKYLDAFLLGFFIYGIFEFTSGAIFKGWYKSLLFVDTIWGGLLYLITYSIFKEIYF